MQRKELVKEITNKTGVEKGAVETILKAFIESVEEHIQNKEHVSLSRFGRFSVKKRAAKKGRNLNNNTPIRIPASTVPVFKPSKVFTRRLKINT